MSRSIFISGYGFAKNRLISVQDKGYLQKKRGMVYFLGYSESKFCTNKIDGGKNGTETDR